MHGLWKQAIRKNLKMIVKKHVSSAGKLVLAICDASLIGRAFEDKEKKLDLSSNFYKGDEMEKEEVKKLMKKSYILNIVGEESLETARELLKISSSNVLYVEGIPHAQVLFIPKDE